MVQVKQIDNDYNYGEETTSLDTTGGPVIFYTLTTTNLQGGIYRLDFDSTVRLTSVSNDDISIQVTEGAGAAGTNTLLFSEIIRFEPKDPRAVQRLPVNQSRDITLTSGVKNINIEIQRFGNGGTLTMFYGSIRLQKVSE